MLLSLAEAETADTATSPAPAPAVPAAAPPPADAPPDKPPKRVVERELQVRLVLGGVAVYRPRDADGDECEIEESAAIFASADLDMESLVLATVASPAFRSAVGSP